jgi:hypothetical protein
MGHYSAQAVKATLCHDAGARTRHDLETIAPRTASPSTTCSCATSERSRCHRPMHRSGHRLSRSGHSPWWCSQVPQHRPSRPDVLRYPHQHSRGHSGHCRDCGHPHGATATATRQAPDPDVSSAGSDRDGRGVAQLPVGRRNRRTERDEAGTRWASKIANGPPLRGGTWRRGGGDAEARSDVTDYAQVLGLAAAAHDRMESQARPPLKARLSVRPLLPRRLTVPPRKVPATRYSSGRDAYRALGCH